MFKLNGLLKVVFLLFFLELDILTTSLAAILRNNFGSLVSFIILFILNIDDCIGCKLIGKVHSPIVFAFPCDIAVGVPHNVFVFKIGRLIFALDYDGLYRIPFWIRLPICFHSQCLTRIPCAQSSVTSNDTQILTHFCLGILEGKIYLHFIYLKDLN